MDLRNTVERYYATEQILGLPSMNRVHNESPDGPNTHYLSQLGRRVAFNAARGNHSGLAMLVKIPNDTEIGDWLVLNGDDFSAMKADASVAGIVGVAMASVDGRINDTTKDLFGWITIEGRMAAKLEPGTANGADLTLDAGFTAGRAGAGGSMALNAKAMSAVATGHHNEADPNNIPEFGQGYGEVYIWR